MIPNVGGTEMVILLAIVLLLFGVKRVPDFARPLGSGVREFCGGMSGANATLESRETVL